MSLAAMTWAWGQGKPDAKEPLTDGEKLTLMALADHADDDGECWPGQKYLAEKCGTTDRTIRRRLKTLQDKGYITREHRQREDGSRTSDLIVLAMRTETSGRTEANRTTASGREPSVPVDAGKGSQTRLKEEELQPRSGCSVGRHRLTRGEWRLATMLLDHFNQLAGTKLGKLTSRRDPSPHIKQIVERIREWPDLTDADHRQILDVAFTHPWWKGKPGVGVVYGPKAFPRAVSRERPSGARSYERPDDPEDKPW